MGRIQLPNNVSSPQDLKEAINDVQKYAAWAAQALVKSRVTRSGISQPPAVTQSAVDLIKQWHDAQPITPKSLDGLIAALKDYEQSAVKVSITLAAVPSGGLKTAMTTWCRQNMSDEILVEFKYNSAILGGLVLRFGSRIYDWSFRRKILANLDNFPEILRNV